MGDAFKDLSLDTLIELAKEESTHIDWVESSGIKEEDYMAVWGWDANGTYEVALAVYYERTDEEVNEMCKWYNDDLSECDMEILKSGWDVKFMSECMGPVIKPSPLFLTTRPPLTLDGKRALKKVDELSKAIEIIDKVRDDLDNKGIILSAVSCENGQVFINTTKGNYYIPKSAYDANRAMLGILTLESLRESGINVIPVIGK